VFSVSSYSHTDGPSLSTLLIPEPFPTIRRRPLTKTEKEVPVYLATLMINEERRHGYILLRVGILYPTLDSHILSHSACSESVPCRGRASGSSSHTCHPNFMRIGPLEPEIWRLKFDVLGYEGTLDYKPRRHRRRLDHVAVDCEALRDNHSPPSTEILAQSMPRHDVTAT
jgi:hypothetical protein